MIAGAPPQGGTTERDRHGPGLVLADTGMADTPNVKTVMGRLDTALSQLEAAVHRHVEAGERFATAEDELQRLGEDRSKLAQDLDSALARADRLEDTNREVSRRLVSAMETIRAVLNDHGG